MASANAGAVRRPPGRAASAPRIATRSGEATAFIKP